MEKVFCPYCGIRLVKKILEGHNRLFCEQCQNPLYENPVPATAALISNQQGEILLVRRAIDPGEGKWCLPGGFVEVGESPEECVLRELEEETAQKGEIDRFLGIEMSHNVLYKSVMVAAYSIRNLRGDARPGDDAVEIGYFKIDQLPEIAFASHGRIIEKAFVKPERKLPYRFGAYVITSGDHVKMAGAACRAGAKILQYRDKTATAGQKLTTAYELREVTRKHGTILIINDQIDLALLTQADGAHLGQDDLPICEARKIVPPAFIIGVSTHSAKQALMAADQGADYIGTGPVFATPTKMDYPAIGLEVVWQVLSEVKIPVVAIGGINLENIGQLKEIGVQNVAMVREYQKDPYGVVRRVNAILSSDET